MSSRFKVKRIIGDRLGAEIEGDLRKDIGAKELQELHKLYLEHSWLLFRGQHGLTPEQQDLVVTAFGKDQKGGEYDTNVISNVTSNTEKIDVDEKGNSFLTGALSFHSDGEFFETPLTGLVLYALELVDDLTYTRFANGHHAYLALPPELKARCEGRDALHVFAYVQERNRCVDVPPHAPRWPSPILDRHKESGKPFISISKMFVDSISGLSETESEKLIQDVFDHFYAPEHIIKHVWRQGDYVVWDNNIFQHSREDVSNVGRRIFRRNNIGEKDLSVQFIAYQREYERRQAAAAAR